MVKETAKFSNQEEVIDILSEHVEDRWDEFDILTERRFELVKEEIKQDKHL